MTGENTILNPHRRYRDHYSLHGVRHDAAFGYSSGRTGA